MKKLLFFVALFCSFCSFAQQDPIGGTPATSVTIIKRENTATPIVNEIQSSNQSAIATAALPTGSSSEVGVTEGQLSVSLTGGATYAIPIAVPPGINGVVPQVSLTYNSQGGNGLAGYGWNISGISVITRIPSTKFHDGVIDAIDFDWLDRFAFDGKRLIVKDNVSAYGANGTIYETESFSNVKITSFGVHPNGANYGPAYFIVEYPDGSTAHYGFTNTSRSVTDWAITYWQNPQGVRISYKYYLQNNILTISTITYGSTFETAPINAIHFFYIPRNRSEQTFMNEHSLERNIILQEIQIFGNNVVFRKYSLTHETTSLRYQNLKSITEQSGNNSQIFNPIVFNPTVFNYDATTNTNFEDTGNTTISNFNNINFINHSTISGDFDGDSKMDFILYPTTGINAKKKFSLFTNITGTSSTAGSELFIGDFSNIFTTSWLSANNKLMPMQGWCAVQFNTTSGETIFKNFSTGVTVGQSILSQYSKSYVFPKFAYNDYCSTLLHCDLLPIENSTSLNKTIAFKNETPVNIGTEGELDPIYDIGLDPKYCPNPVNLAVTQIDNNEATFSWTQSGSSSISSWEVCYFEINTSFAPNNYDPIGTYTIVNQNVYTAQNLNPDKNYTFFVRAICNRSAVSIWMGPKNIIDIIVTPPIVVQYKDIPKEYLNGDFNGDGLTDVIAIEKNSVYSAKICQANCYTTTNITIPGGKTYFVDLDRRLTSNFVIYAGFIEISNTSKFEIADVNGDGKSDVIVFDSGNVKTYFLNNNNQLVLGINYSDSNILSNKHPLMGDFNGDGKTDFVIPQAINVDRWSFFFSKGNSFYKDTKTIGFRYNETTLENNPYGYGYIAKNFVDHTFIPIDINMDGKTDIVRQRDFTLQCFTSDNIGWDCSLKGTPNGTQLSLLENIGSNIWGINFSLLHTQKQLTGLKRYPIPIFLDHNNFNQNLEYALISGNSIRTFKSTKNNSIDTRLKEIILGNGVKEAITYAPLNDKCSVGFNCDIAFEPSTFTENYPNFDIKVSNSFQVVSKLEQVTTTQYKQQKFRYYGAVSNVEGLGFLGFRSLSRTNWYNTNNPIISSISKHDIIKRGAIFETFTVLGETYGNLSTYTPYSFINKTNMTYAHALLLNKVFKINNTFTISTNGLESTSKEVSTTYDTNNNPLSTTSVSKNGTTVERTEVVNIEYFPNTTSPNYIIGRLKKKNSTVTHNGDTITGEEIYTYNAAHLVSKIQKKGHSTNYLTEDNVYDAIGNITQKKITAVGLTPRITNFTYDTSGRFLLSSTDIESLVTSYTYNTSNGLMLTQTLPSNAGFPLITSYLYDVWGKKTKETDYLGKSLNYSYSWLSPGTSGFFGTSSAGDDNSASFSWYDDLGRKIADGFRTINDASSSESNNSWKTFEYDIYDRVKKSYEPKLSLLPLWEGMFSSTTYDAYGRTTQVVQHTNKTSNIDYNGLTTTASDGVSNSTVVKNSLGSVASMTDNGGTINYQYYANGNLKQSNFGGVIVSVEQDGWGRKTKLTDPSAGIYEYQYNELGEMKKEITPKGVTTYSLDNFGKVTEKTITGTGGDPTNTKTTYTYNPTTKLLTNTRYDDFAGGFYTVYSYGYDNYKRINFNDESGFNAYYQRATQFDAFGRPEKELYSAVNTSNSKQSSKWVKNTYKNGHHWQILDDATSQVLWQTSKVNAKGQLLSANYGNGISITNTYDQYGFPTQFKHDKTTAPVVNVMTLNTTFAQQQGNLTYRYNSMFDYREDFTYDNLNRLTSWKETGELLCDCNFNANLQGFQTVNAASVSWSSNQLNVSGVVGSTGKGTEKLVVSNAALGKKVNIKGKLTIATARAGTTVHISFYSKNPATGATVGYTTLGMPIGNGNFSYGTTIGAGNLQDLYVMFLMRNPSNPSAYIALSLDDIKITMEEEESQTYDALGRIDDNSIGGYNYTNTPKPFQNTSIELNSDAASYYLSRANLDITYNAFKSPVNIIEEGKDKLSFIYNMNNSRSTMYYGSLEADKLSRRFRKHYAADGSMEIKQDMVNGTVEFITYIGGDAYSAPIILKSDATTQQYMYLHRDHLGSILAVTNQAGAVVEKRLFDAWGNISKVQDGTGNNLTKLTVTDRGYTGHEHLQGVNLIHMNGRLYDPVVHRFLQPDNFVQEPFNTQNYNRYSYVLNNPLKYTDPSGEWFGVDDLIAGLIGGVINLGVNIWQGNIKGNFWQVLGSGTAAFGAGFGAGVLSLYGPGGWIAAGALIGGTNAWLSGTDPVMGVITGAASGLVGGYVGTWASSAINGVVVNGIKIASPLLQGTITGSIAGGFTGGVLGFGFSLAQGNSFGQSLQMGFQGFQMGLLTGGISGGASASATAIKNNINPVNGNDLRPITSDVIKARHHTSAENMFKMKDRGVMFPSRDSGFGSSGVDFENYPTFSGNQNEFSFQPAGKGAFIEMQFPKSVLTPNPSPMHPYHVRIITNNQNLIISPEFRPRYYINFNF